VKANARVLLPLLLLLPVCPLQAKGSPELAGADAGLSLRAWLAADTVGVTLRFDARHSAEVLSALREGLKSQLLFQLRLYRRQDGPLALLGDRLLSSRELTRIASFDLIDDRYRVVDETGQREYTAQAAFLEDFYILRDYPLGSLAAAEGPQCYLVARARLEPVRVVPPLDIIRLVTRVSSFSSPWMRADIETQVP
jgi:hypothetical protein